MNSLKRILFLSIVFALFSCTNSEEEKANETMVKFEFGESLSSFIPLIESVEYIPLETDTSLVLDSEPELYLSKEDFYIVNKRDYNLNHGVYRYSFAGNFLNSIGQHGRGSGEYVHIYDFQITGDTALIFSDGKLLEYNKAGTLLSEHTLSSYGDAFISMANGHILTYYGYGSLKDYRFALETIGDTVLIEKYFSSERNRNFVHITPFAPIFSFNKPGLMMLDPIHPIVYVFKDNNLVPYITFDFGEYGVADKYYKLDDVYASMEYLEKIAFAYILRYRESDYCKLVEIFLNTEDKTKSGLYYGLYRDNAWHWFRGGKLFGENTFDGTFRCLLGDTLYFIMTPTQTKNMPSEIASLAINPKSIANLKEDDNYVITKIKLK